MVAANEGAAMRDLPRTHANKGHLAAEVSQSTDSKSA